MTKQEMIEVRLDSLLERIKKARDFVKTASEKADQRMQAHLASIEQEKAQENKAQELA
jgi:hypothetical protein